MGKLSDILKDDGNLLRAWDAASVAADSGAIPAGDYIARIVSGELFTSRSAGTPGYKLSFRILEGEFAGRQFWHDAWLTAAALPMTKRDLAKLGVVNLTQLERPLPQGIRCKVKLALRRTDSGDEFNRVAHFEVLGIDPPELDPFAPPAEATTVDDERPAEGDASSENAVDDALPF
jgi:hypothetical protein